MKTDKKSKDTLGDRMKNSYENRTRYYLPRRTYTILRLDQKAGHTYTRGLNKPFDTEYMEDMDSAVIEMMPEIQGAVFAYIQSDEVSILLTDFEKITTSAWFDGNLQKMTSVAASIMTAAFNRRRLLLRNNVTGHYELVGSRIPLAYFDCRAFTVPDRTEVMNVFRWRQQDCIRNSVSMVAQANFSHKELHGKSQSDMHEMLHQKGINWVTDYTESQKNGRVIVKETYEEPIVNLHVNTLGETLVVPPTASIKRSRWVSQSAWIFTQDEGKLLSMIPKYE